MSAALETRVAALEQAVNPEPVYGRPPSRLETSSVLGSVPGLAAQFRQVVPDKHWERDGAGVIVHCPCGHELRAPVGVTGCECDRFFLWSGRGLRVARYPGWRETEQDGDE